MAIEDALADWLGNQRWFAGKGLQLRDLTVVADTEVVAGEPELRHLIVAVSHGTDVTYYQVPVGLRWGLPARLEHARIGPAHDGRVMYDALHDAELTKPLLAGLTERIELVTGQYTKRQATWFRHHDLAAPAASEIILSRFADTAQLSECLIGRIFAFIQSRD